MDRSDVVKEQHSAGADRSIYRAGLTQKNAANDGYRQLLLFDFADVSLRVKLEACDEKLASLTVLHEIALMRIMTIVHH